MKENKFLFYGCILVIIACGMWLRFRMPYETMFTYSEPEITDIEKEPIMSGEFVGCSAQFESKNWAQDTYDRTIERYYATNTITCKCVSKDGKQIIDRTEMYQYFSEPDDAELDCDKECANICAE